MNLSTHGLGDLYGKRTNAARRAIDQDLLSGLKIAFIAKGLQGGKRGDRQRRSLLECHALRDVGDGSILGNKNVLGEGSSATTENPVTDFEVRDFYRQRPRPCRQNRHPGEYRPVIRYLRQVA